MKKLLASSLGISVIALTFAACTTAQNPNLVSTNRPAAGAGQTGYLMPPASNVHQSQGGAMILDMQQRAPGGSRP